MKIDKSLKDVWDWKEKVYEETKYLSIKKTAENIHRGAEQFCNKYGLKLKVYNLPQRSIDNL